MRPHMRDAEKYARSLCDALTTRWQKGGKHVRLVLSFNGVEQSVFMSVTPRCDGTSAIRRDVRRVVAALTGGKPWTNCERP